jgi:DNA-directed RNA polymerase subunit K/omega
MDKIQYTKFEMARLIGARALQLSMGAPYLLKLTNKQLEQVAYNPIRIAQMEQEKDVIPLTVVRPEPRRMSEAE